MQAHSLQDYRATHFLMNLLRAHLQGWYTRDNILLQAGHPGGDEDKLAALAGIIDTVASWNAAIEPGRTPFISDDGTVNRPEQLEDVCRLLGWLFDQHAKMNRRLNDILDRPQDLSERKEDFQYVIACMGWIHYSVNHQVLGDNHFAERFQDVELARAREGEAEASRKEIEFIGYMSRALQDPGTYTPEIGSDLVSMIETLMNETMKQSAERLDYYLRIFGK